MSKSPATNGTNGTKEKAIEPLRARTMSLDTLQRRTLEVIKQTIKQFDHHYYEDGLSDRQFVDQVLRSFAEDIKVDRLVLARRRKKESH